MYEIIGINADQDVCDVCGKQELQKVVWLENLETQEVIACGTSCAAKLRKIKTSIQKRGEKTFQNEQKMKFRKNAAIWHKVHNEVSNEAPRLSGSHKVSFKERMSFIKNHPDTIKADAMIENLMKKYNQTSPYS